MKKSLLIILFLFSHQLFAEEVYATFTVHARQNANLAFSYSGIVKDINADIMSEVKKDDVLATLVSDDLIATHNATKVELKYAKLEYERHKDLYAKKLIDKSQLDKYALAYESLLAKIEYEKTIFAKTILTAPFDGVITHRYIESGDVVSGQMIKTAFTIQSPSQRVLVAEFDQKYNNQVKIGDSFIFTVDGDSKQHKAKIDRIYPQANEDNRKIYAQVFVEGIKVGMFGEGKIITSATE
ncbi:MAG TPA: efflux RND transporter periplasmic adaptor subunit [Gammaproteobacteria bacterium]|jgi:RND family efflux transporter MFP subunit|nr:efflux RND transporter periplasmic adaptor subunit [Xanthomonadales bacterium]HOP21333.1 efflux RND transporter periplasmic adaptor subunit [Gammaproteobacteria bacterium]MCB1595577.1 efflux RND transporter periplasmic adaptor subunit [Xanthomonadales bacterium]MCB1603031.1 efflux RND transporter periplasmic adaptor subunit [Xanthomonadales bacterium]HPI94865.1 efflux RND transporter periplasmic adaptor subunit [Gammaproteobacteria bacterium]